jgi:hypothetical protein
MFEKLAMFSDIQPQLQPHLPLVFLPLAHRSPMIYKGLEFSFGLHRLSGSLLGVAQNTMQHTIAVTFAVLALTIIPCAQDNVPIFKTEAASAFVWGESNSNHC